MSLFSTVLHASGRHGRQSFWIGLVVTVAVSFAQIYLLRAVGTNMYGFLLGLFLLCLVIYMAYCVYVKRLHDIGRSAWMFFGMMTVTLILAILVQQKFGGLEYFDTLMANPERHEDAAWMLEQREIYAQTLSEARPLADIVLWSPLALLTLWLGVKPGDPE